MRNQIPRSKQLAEFDYAAFKDPVKFSKNNIFTPLHGIGFYRNDIFYGTFRDELRRLFEGGFLEHNFYKNNKVWTSDPDDLKSGNKLFKEHIRKQSEVVLSWNYLHPGFYLWFGACIISTLVFIGEIVAHSYTRFVEKMRNLFIFL